MHRGTSTPARDTSLRGVHEGGHPAEQWSSAPARDDLLRGVHEGHAGWHRASKPKPTGNRTPGNRVMPSPTAALLHIQGGGWFWLPCTCWPMTMLHIQRGMAISAIGKGDTPKKRKRGPVKRGSSAREAPLIEGHSARKSPVEEERSAKETPLKEGAFRKGVGLKGENSARKAYLKKGQSAREETHKGKSVPQGRYP